MMCQSSDFFFFPSRQMIRLADVVPLSVLRTDMPVYARRRLQAVMNDLSPLLTAKKARDILSRVEHKNTKDALAAEVELGLLWAIQHVADLEIDREWAGSSSRPDAFSHSLFKCAPASIEITALSDDTFSGREDMERAANIICQFANRVRKGGGNHLYFQFAEHSYYEQGRLFRKRLITADFKLTQQLKETLRAWLSSSDWPNPVAIRLVDTNIEVVVQWKKYVHPHGRTFCTMPPVAYHPEDNPIYRALVRKEKQLSGVPSGILKCVFLGDAGCGMLRELKPFGVHEVCGEQVIKHFLRNSSIDVVGVFSPYRSFQVFQMPGSRSPQWKVNLYMRTDVPSEGDCVLVKRMVAEMLVPQLEGYQARSWHQQGLFNPQGRGIYLGTTITTKVGALSIKVSARLMLELLSGKITQQEFERHAFGDHQNQFAREFGCGFTIQGSRLESGGLDEDDDYLVFDMAPDFAAKALENPKE